MWRAPCPKEVECELGEVLREARRADFRAADKPVHVRGDGTLGRAARLVGSDWSAPPMVIVD